MLFCFLLLVTVGSVSNLSQSEEECTEASLNPGIGFLPAEIKLMKNLPADSVIGFFRDKLMKNVKLNLKVPLIEPGKHVTNEKNYDEVPRGASMQLGFLREYNRSLDDLGLAYLITGDKKYADIVARHILEWGRLSPPLGEGGMKGGQPSVMYREFYSMLRAIWNVWPVFGKREREAAVNMCFTLQDKLVDWWGLTPWERGNHQAASNLTGLYAGIVLLRASEVRPDLVSHEEAINRIKIFLTAGKEYSTELLITGNPRSKGLVGFEPQIRLGIYNANLKEYYAKLYKKDLLQEGVSLDYCYKPASKRLMYHHIYAHHVLTAYWVIRRNSLDEQFFANPDEVREQISRMLEWGRQIWEQKKTPKGSGVKAGDAAEFWMTREILLMADKLFPEKKWIRPIIDRAKSVSTQEIYYEISRQD
ncbi:MAG: hypothetical protein HY606_02475 [Planctomycetes bacterium]|nr:hypothetical protein [Planctomycetota bacterium]